MKSIFSISFLIIAIALFFAVVNPLYKNVSKLKSEVDTYNLALSNSTELQKIRDSLIDTYKGIKQEDKDRLEHFLPSSINNIQLILEVEKMASLYGMPIKNIKFENEKLVNISSDNNVLTEAENLSENLPYGTFPIEFSIDGRYSDFVSFLRDMEYNLRLINIKSISFNVPSSSTSSTAGTINPTTGGIIDPSIYSYILKAEIYWLK